MPRPPAGWYDHPTEPGKRCYWDGEVWTDRTAPADQPPPPKRSWPRWEAAGIICMLLFWPGGILIGAVLVAKGSTTKTPWVVLVMSALIGASFIGGRALQIW